MIELKENLINKLLQLFPNIDIGYLNKIIDNQIQFNSSNLINSIYNNNSNNNLINNRKGKGKALNQNENENNNNILRLEERIIERITTKMLEFNRGNYPITTFDSSKFCASSNIIKKGESSKTFLNQENLSLESAKTMDRNLALIHLHQIFPNTPIATLRNLLLSLPNSFLFTAVDELLANPTQSPPIPQRPSSYLSSFFSNSKPASSSSAKVLQVNPILLPSDLFRSEEYTEALTVHLKSLFPLVPLFTIKAVVADGGSYSEIRNSVESWRAKTSKVKVWLSDVFLNSTSTITSTSPNKNTSLVGEESELEKEIWEFEAPIREAKVKEDEKLARKLNSEWSKKESKYECGCCFDDAVEFLDVGFCSSGSHSFCRSCIGRQVEEHVYGQAPLRILVEQKIEQGAEGEGIGVRCLSTEGCLSPFSHTTLERLLSPTLFSALSRRLSESALELLQQAQFNSIDDETIIRCPFCSYSEIGDGAVFKRAFPFLTAIRKKTLSIEGLFLYPLVDIFASFNLLHLYGIAYIFISCFPTSFSHLAGRINSTPSSSQPPPSNSSTSEDNPTFFPLLEPHRVILVAHRFITSIGRKILTSRNGNRNTFQCRNGPNHSPQLPFGQALTTTNNDSIGEVVVIEDFNDLVKKVWPGWKLNESSSNKVATGIVHKVTVGKAEGRGRGGVQETCGRLSCLSCERIYVDGRHVCHEDEKEGLRLAIEKAIDAAVKRKCSQCGLSYQKDGGCNKIVCRCGYVSCYTCRMGIKEESYSHFCSHFRNILGASCSQCNLCSLWETPDDKIAIELATTRAKEEWIREHPQTTREALTQRIGHNVKQDPIRYFSNYVEYFLRFLL